LDEAVAVLAVQLVGDMVFV